MAKILFVLLTLMIAGTANAKIKRSTTKPVVFPVKPPEEGITEKDVEALIPMDLKSGEEATIPARIADRGFQMWFQSPQVQSSLIGRTADTVQQKMKTDVTVAPTEPNGVEHKFSFQVLAAQTMARLQYVGWLHGAYSYDAHAATSMLELSNKVFNKDLFLTVKKSSAEDVSSVGIKWSW